MLELKITLEAGKSIFDAIEALSKLNFLSRPVGSDGVEHETKVEQKSDLAGLASRDHASAIEAQEMKAAIAEAILADAKKREADAAAAVQAPQTTATQTEPTVEDAHDEPAEVVQADAPVDDARGKGVTGADLASLTREFLAEIQGVSIERATLNKNLRKACDELQLAIASVPALITAIGYGPALRACTGEG